MSAQANVDLDAERAVLGALILDASRIPEVVERLRAEGFFDRRHAIVFEALASMSSHGVPVEIVTLGEELSRRNALRAVGGRAFLAELICTVTSPAHLTHHVGIVARCARARAIIERCKAVISRVDGSRLGDDELTDVAEQLASEMRDSIATVANGERSALYIVQMSTVSAAPVAWLWPGRIALGKLTLLAGDPGLGKSFLTLDVAARVSRGRGWPDDPRRMTEPASVLLLSAEDDAADTIRPRLDAAGADTSRVYLLKSVSDTRNSNGEERAFTLERDLHALESELKTQTDVRLVIVDPISAYTGKIDSHVNSEVRALLAPLAEIAARSRVAVLAVTHLNKNSMASAIYRAMGSLAFTAAARAVLVASKDKDRPSRRFLTIAKNNIASDGLALAYEISAGSGGSAPCVCWEPEPVQLTADDALSSQGTSTADRTERSRAGEFLREELRSGPVASKDVHQHARDNAIAKKTLERAANDLGVKRRKTGFGGGWVWSLDEDGQHPGEDRQPPSVGTLASGGHLGAVAL